MPLEPNSFPSNLTDRWVLASLRGETGFLQVCINISYSIETQMQDGSWSFLPWLWVYGVLFSFCCVLFCISLSKAEMTSVFNSFISKNPISLSNNSNHSNRSVCHSIKKAATVSTQLQKTSGLPQILIVAVALLSLFTPTQFLMCYR